MFLVSGTNKVSSNEVISEVETTANAAYAPTDVLSTNYCYVSYSTSNTAIHTKANDAYVQNTKENQQINLPSSEKLATYGLNSRVSENVPLTDNPAYQCINAIRASSLESEPTISDYV